MKRNQAVSSVIIMVCVFAPWAAAQVLDESEAKHWDPKIAPERLPALKAARDTALADMRRLVKAGEAVRVFRQNNDRAYGLPSDLDELGEMHKAASAFAEGELREISAVYDLMMEKYEASSSEQLDSTLQQAVNPPEWDDTPEHYPDPANFLERDLKWVKEFLPRLETALKEKEQATVELQAAQNKPKALSSFPKDSYRSGDLADVKRQMIAALIGPVAKSRDEILDIRVTGDWAEGVYGDTKQAYRKIQGTALFSDSDNDGVSRYSSYVFISDKAGGDWQPLKFKAFCTGCAEGWAKPHKGALGDGAKGGGGPLGVSMWLLLVVANLLAGLVAGGSALERKLPAIGRITGLLKPLSIPVGVFAATVGILAFLASILSRSIFAGIVPQLTAIVAGLVLALELIESKVPDRVADWIAHNEHVLNAVHARSGLLGIVALVAGASHLLLGGLLYVI